MLFRFLFHTFQWFDHIDLFKFKIHRSVYDHRERNRQKKTVYKTAHIDISAKHNRIYLDSDNDKAMKYLSESDAEKSA